MTDATWLFDLDGTLLNGAVPLPGAVETVRALVERGDTVGYATNDAVLTLDQQYGRLRSAGFPVREGLLASAASVAVWRIAEAAKQRPQRVLVVGAAAVAAQLAAFDGTVRLVDRAPADVVVAGLDPDLDYGVLARATQALHGGARFLATNADPFFVAADGRPMPGAGAVVAALETASLRKAEVVGKPSGALFRALLAAAGVAAGPVVVVGDADTDILAGLEIGAITIRLAAAPDPRAPRPAHRISHLTELLEPGLEALFAEDSALPCR